MFLEVGVHNFKMHLFFCLDLFVPFRVTKVQGISFLEHQDEDKGITVAHGAVLIFNFCSPQSHTRLCRETVDTGQMCHMVCLYWYSLCLPTEG